MFLSFAQHFTVPVKINFRCVLSTRSPPPRKPILFLFLCWGFQVKTKKLQKREIVFTRRWCPCCAPSLPFCQLFNVYGMQQYQGDYYIIYALYTSGVASATCAPNNVQLSRRERPFLSVSQF